MRDEVRTELLMLESTLKSGMMEADKSNNFVDKWDYEDEYSGNEISDIQADFEYYAKKYLQEHYKGQYAIKIGISNVSVITVEFMNKRELKGWIVC